MAFKGIAVFFLVVAFVSTNPMLQLQYNPLTFDMSNFVGGMLSSVGDRAGDFLNFPGMSRAVQFPFEDESGEENLPADLLSTPGIIKYNGYPCEEHFLTTSDGYILGIHRIPSSPFIETAGRRQPVYLQHGLLDSSATWVMAGRGRGLAFILADCGYDVWLGNVRGNRYSRNHTIINPSGERSERKQFWSFSWHEIGMIDLPTMIDYILDTTEFEQLHYVGHSQGTTAFFVMASERPEYNDKVIMMHALAPIAFMGNIKGTLAKTMATVLSNTEFALRRLGQYEFMPSKSVINTIAYHSCRVKAIAKGVCRNIIFLAGGENPDKFDDLLLPTILRNTPAGSSLRQITHYGQLIKSNRFAMYDYGGIKNSIHYGTICPPSYHLKSIRVPVNLVYSVNDLMADIIDVQTLNDQLPNVVSLYQVKDELFTHFDFVWGLHAKEQVYDHVIEMMENGSF